MIRVLYRQENEKIRTRLTLQDIAAALLDPHGLLWVDIAGEPLDAIITTLCMPLTFVAAFFGMNFFQPRVPLNIWTYQSTFFITLAGMVIAPIGMYVWMRRRKWLQ